MEEDDKGRIVEKGDRDNTQLASPALTPVLEHAGLPNSGARGKNDKGLPSGRSVAKGQEQYSRLVDGINETADSSRDRSQSSPLQGLQTNVDEVVPNASTASSNRRLTTPTVSIEKPEVLKLSAAQIKELTSEPGSIPIRQGTPVFDLPENINEEHYFQTNHSSGNSKINGNQSGRWLERTMDSPRANGLKGSAPGRYSSGRTPAPIDSDQSPRPDAKDHIWGLRSVSMPSASKENTPGPKVTQDSTFRLKEPRGSYSGTKERRDSSAAIRSPDTSAPDGLKALQENMKASASKADSIRNQSQPVAATPAKMPLPPFSMPTHLHLELSSTRPSPLYLHRSASYEYAYEPSRVKFQRLLNFLLLPPQLERILLFGALTCLDSWLYTFTILPLRFVKALWILVSWLVIAAAQELYRLPAFVYNGLGRIWRRHRKRDASTKPGTDPISSISSSVDTPSGARNRQMSSANASNKQTPMATSRPRAVSSVPKLKRGRSSVSLLLPSHKADIIQGFLILASCALLMRFDASRMYHSVRGQAAIKLYVIYNVLEVFDRLFSALGQDVIECLFSEETLERKSNGRSKITRPFWMFLLALAYTVIHSTALLYQVITLNVAVNSYSNALLTLLMSNQFVEIKGTVFKKFEKENLFQLTCADIVERFQLWLMLLIIALRNIVELGGLSIPSSSNDFSGPASSGPMFSNSTSSGGGAATGSAPMRTFNIIPHAFTLIPSIMPAQVLMPFLLVLGSEMLVDWLKHAYITKFNATRPAIYSRFLDVLAKDYYSNAFASQNLTKRLGLPVIPLACLFIRAALQTYHMFLATILPAPTLSTSTSLTDASSGSTSSPALAQIDHILRSALGRSSSFDASSSSSLHNGSTSYIFPLSLVQSSNWTLDDTIALATKLTFFALLYLLLLAFKLLLGMGLLHFSRGRYAGMKARQEQERASAYTERESRRVGGWGTIELGEDRRRTIYEGDETGLRRALDREERGRPLEKGTASSTGGGNVVSGSTSSGGGAPAPAPAPAPAAGVGAATVNEKRSGGGLESVDRYSMVAKRIW